jgi:hypothetical protein
MSDEKENGVRDDPMVGAAERGRRLAEEATRALATTRRDGVDAFVDKVLLSKPVSPITRRAIMAQIGYHTMDVERLNREHQQKLNEIATDAAVSEGIDLSVYMLNVPGDVPPYWKPR